MGIRAEAIGLRSGILDASDAKGDDLPSAAQRPCIGRTRSWPRDPGDRPWEGRHGTVGVHRWDRGKEEGTEEEDDGLPRVIAVDVLMEHRGSSSGAGLSSIGRRWLPARETRG
jgi:hypothetical protein